jgi:hypothetical protein
MKENTIRVQSTNNYFSVQEPYFVTARSSVPEWYKNMPLYTDGLTKYRLKPNSMHTNVGGKACVPFLDSLTLGYTVKLSADIQVTKTIDPSSGIEAPSFQWRTPVPLISGHSLGQTNGLPAPDGYYKSAFKFESYLSISTPKGYSCLFVHPLNQLDLPFITFSGVVDTDKYPDAINFPFILSKTFDGIIESGTPLIQIIPFKREDWNSVIDPFSENDAMRKSHQVFKKIHRTYKSQFWSKKNYS